MNQAHHQKVHLFVPCIVNQFYPSVAEAGVHLLKSLGYDVIIPRNHVCCGQPAFNSGHWDEARKVAGHFLKNFQDAKIIIGISGSCISMIRHEYNKLNIILPDDLQIFEITEFLYTQREHLHFRETRQMVAFHDSCHALRKLGIEQQPRELLSQIPGTEIVELDDHKECCGFGGTFSIKMPHVSVDMALSKVQSIKRTRVQKVTSVDMGCLMNIGSTARTHGYVLATCHVIELLAEALE